MFRQTTALHENLQPPHLFEWTGVWAQRVCWHRGLGQKNSFGWLNFCEKAKSSGKVLHGPNKYLPAHFPDYFIMSTQYLSCLSGFDHNKRWNDCSVLISQSSKILPHNIYCFYQWYSTYLLGHMLLLHLEQHCPTIATPFNPSNLRWAFVDK